VLEVLETVVARPWYVDTPSEATLYRHIDATAPALLLDEFDAIFSDKSDREGMRALLNAGFRRGRKVPHCIRAGADMKVKEFRVFCPKALAGIGRLPTTIETRKIPVELMRKTEDEHVERFRLRAISEEADEISKGLASWAKSVIKELQDARPHLPNVLSDRQQDIWEPLLAIADFAGEQWPKRARDAAKSLHTSEGTLSDGMLLLAHIQDALGDDSNIHTSVLLEILVERDDGPWAVWWSKDLSNGEHPGPRGTAGAAAPSLRDPVEESPLRSREHREAGIRQGRFRGRIQALSAPLCRSRNKRNGRNSAGSRDQRRSDCSECSVIYGDEREQRHRGWLDECGASEAVRDMRGSHARYSARWSAEPP
jgi:hypothetical protein